MSDSVETTFYMGYCRHYPYDILPWVEENGVPLLENAVHRWSEAQEKFLDMWEYDTRHVMDSGGYNVQAKYVDQWGNLRSDQGAVEEELQKDSPFYPWTVVEYNDWLNENADEIEWAAAMDYACEDRFDPLWCVQERIDATVENTVKQYEMDRDYKLLPVLQGQNIEDWVECVERLQDAGVDISHVGIGTVCRISSEERIVTVERELRDRLPDEVEKMHGFGVKVSAFKHGAAFDSTDSFSWVDRPMNGNTFTLHQTEDGYVTGKGEMSDDARQAHLHSFQVYYSYGYYLANGEEPVDMQKLIEKQDDFEYTNVRIETREYTP